jgi:hypothetical protein
LSVSARQLKDWQKRKGNLQEEEPEETRTPMNGLSKCSFLSLSFSLSLSLSLCSFGCPTTKMPFLIVEYYYNIRVNCSPGYWVPVLSKMGMK